MHLKPVSCKGRGAADNPPNWFERLSYVPDRDAFGSDDDLPAPRTTLLRDPSRTILSHNASPDIGFTFSVNPYRGCESGDGHIRWVHLPN